MAKKRDNYTTYKNYYENGKLTKSVVDNRTEREKRRDFLKERRQAVGESVSQVSGIFRIISLLLIIAFLSRLLFPTDNNSLPTFQGLLEHLVNAPAIPNTFFNGLSSLKILGDWGIVDGLRVLINTNISILSFSVWLILGLVNLVSFALYIVGWLFGI